MYVCMYARICICIYEKIYIHCIYVYMDGVVSHQVPVETLADADAINMYLFR